MIVGDVHQGVGVGCQYIPSTLGEIFVTTFGSVESPAPKGGIMLLPPFAEEMNKSRRMIALQARALAADGFVAVVPDLFGTGDSEGRFEDGTWEVWNEDIVNVFSWLRAKGIQVRGVVALRSGIFLTMGLFKELNFNHGKLVLWSPVSSGKRLVSQFRRQQMFSTDHGAAAEGPGAQNRTEIAGYLIDNDQLEATKQLEIGDVEIPPNYSIDWFDVTLAPTNSHVSRVPDAVTRWRDAGYAVTYEAVSGRHFWLGPEIEVVPDLVARTTISFKLD